MNVIRANRTPGRRKKCIRYKMVWVVDENSAKLTNGNYYYISWIFYLELDFPANWGSDSKYITDKPLTNF